MTPENISSMKSVLSTLILGEDLSDEQTSFAMEQILQGQCDDAQIAAFITLLRAKGETANEFSSMVRTMWDNTPEVPADDMTDVIDTCGTGGDQSGTFNISTAASLVLASCSIRVAKHGNRAMSSQCGAADVLEAVGIPVGSTPEQCEKMFNETGFTFLFAPTFHPGMRFAGPVRASLAIRTTFNFLGPLSNPYHAGVRLHGVSDPSIVPVYAETLKNLGVNRAYVFHGHGGLDEISLSGPTSGLLLLNGEITEKGVDPEEFGFTLTSADELVGGDAQHNAKIIANIFDGEKSPFRDVVVLNAAVGFDLVHGVGLDVAIEKVTTAIDSGATKDKVREISDLAQSLQSGNA